MSGDREQIKATAPQLGAKVFHKLLPTSRSESALGSNSQRINTRPPAHNRHTALKHRARRRDQQAFS
ncbi:hypothetical protein RRG08_047199 [Elysia crispata]|uniref:Uncharacterized protein n=1 Tax=Elysia crispata TaxID=231223 RepID=A0AAE1EE20_9GAST|nr:hypothetical protein RRG08_047199 [Elysia crispata]